MDAELLRLRRRASADGDANAVARYRRALLTRFGASTRSLLDDRLAWNAASPFEQDAALASVAEQLLPGWTWTETRTYACGGQEHRIATFVERSSRIPYRLLPGGRYRRGTVDPAAEAQACGVRAPDASWMDDPRLERWRYDDEAPAHELTVPPFLLAATPLTKAQWRRSFPHVSDQSAPYRYVEVYLDPDVQPEGRPPFVREPDQPVMSTDPLTHRAWLSFQEQEALRLPSEAEWEYACRAGTETRYTWGDAFDPARCWCHGTTDPKYKGPPPVTGHAGVPNAFGLIDMHGGVWELCADRRATHHQGVGQRVGYGDGPWDHRPLEGATSPMEGWVLRGGGWADHPTACRSATRRTLFTEIGDIGLRPARSLPAPGAQVADGSLIPRRAIGNLWVRLLFGDLAGMKTDVLVNAANHELEMGGGVAGALLAVCGLEVAKEAARHALAAVGDVVRTGAGAAEARFVYHAVVIHHSLRAGTSAADVRVVTRKAIAMAFEDGVESICLPLFGSGVGGLSLAQSLEAILEGLEEAADPSRPMLGVRVVAHTEDEFVAASEAWWGFPDRATRAAEVEDAAEAYLRQLEADREP